MTPSARSERREEALRTIVGAASDRDDLLSPSGYRALRDRSGQELPSPTAIWEMFGGFQRMRELALAVHGDEAADAIPTRVGAEYL